MVGKQLEIMILLFLSWLPALLIFPSDFHLFFDIQKHTKIYSAYTEDLSYTHYIHCNSAINLILHLTLTREQDLEIPELLPTATLSPPRGDNPNNSLIVVGDYEPLYLVLDCI